MSVAAGPRFDLDDSFARELVGLHEPWAAVPVAEPTSRGRLRAAGRAS